MTRMRRTREGWPEWGRQGLPSLGPPAGVWVPIVSRVLYAATKGRSE